MLAQMRRQGARQQPSLILGSNGLQPHGYLITQPIDIDLSQAYLLGETVQARRKGKVKDYVAPKLYRTFCAAQQQKKQHKHEQRSDTSNQSPVRYTPSLHEQWPQTKNMGHFRILHTNVHGLNPGKNYLECNYYLQQMAAYQVDMSLAVEVNQPVDNPIVRKRLSSTVHSFDKHAHIQFGHGENASKNFGFQMGGETTVIQGGAKGYLQSSGSDPIGRWTWTSLSETNLNVVNAYRVGPVNDGIQTIRAMEM